MEERGKRKSELPWGACAPPELEVQAYKSYTLPLELTLGSHLRIDLCLSHQQGLGYFINTNENGNSCGFITLPVDISGAPALSDCSEAEGMSVIKKVCGLRAVTSQRWKATYSMQGLSTAVVLSAQPSRRGTRS